MLETAVPIVRRLLAASAGQIAELWVRSFADDEEAHDDILQERLICDFAAAFDESLSELAAEFGPPIRTGVTEDDAVPLNDVFRFAVWTVGDRQVWLAAAHEDREVPFLLLVGTSA